MSHVCCLLSLCNSGYETYDSNTNLKPISCTMMQLSCSDIDNINAIAALPDGGLDVRCCGEETGIEKPVHFAIILSLDVSPDGAVLAISLDDEMTKFEDMVGTGKYNQV